MSAAAEPGIVVRGVRKRFGPLRVLDGVDLAFRSGRVTAILGPNGAGKTTLLKMILRLVRPDEGDITIDGVALNGDAGYRASIGYMPQLPRFPANLTGNELAALLDDVRDFTGVPDERLLDAFGLRGEMDKPFRTLSGGTRQKLNAALAFRYPASALVLDEPTAGLDPVAIGALRERVGHARSDGATVLLTSHDMGQLERLADDVVFLLEGRVEFAGPLADLLRETDRPDLEGAIVSLMTGRPRGPSPLSPTRREVA